MPHKVVVEKLANSCGCVMYSQAARGRKVTSPTKNDVVVMASGQKWWPILFEPMAYATDERTEPKMAKLPKYEWWVLAEL